MRIVVLSLALFLAGCFADETVSGYGAADRVWTLRQIDKVLISEPVTLSFPETGRIAGQAPCNRYFGEQTAPYPWFRVEGVAATKRACPALALERTYLDALAQMTLSEVSGNTLILSNDDGREMIFTTE